MKKTVLILLALMFTCQAFAAEISGLVTSRYLNRKIKKLVLLRDAQVVTKYQFDESGNVLEMSGEKVTGRSLALNSNGRRAAELSLEDGMLNGRCTFYFLDGTRESEFMYQNNKQNGPYRIFYDTGILQQEGTLKSYTLKSEYSRAKQSNRPDMEVKTRKNLPWRLLQTRDDLILLDLIADLEYSKPEGEVRTYGRDGRLEYIDVYLDGQLKAIKYFSPSGALIKEVEIEG